MKVLILSDIHDDVVALRKALEQGRDCAEIICCGDLCSPFVILEFGHGFSRPVHVVFGNNDADRFRMATVAAKFPHINLHGEYCELNMAGVSFAVNHFDNIGRAIAKGGTFDVVCFGHNHLFEISPMEKSLVINPGKIYRQAVFGSDNTASTCVIYDTKTRSATRVDLNAA